MKGCLNEAYEFKFYFSVGICNMWAVYKDVDNMYIPLKLREIRLLEPAAFAAALAALGLGRATARSAWRLGRTARLGGTGFGTRLRRARLTAGLTAQYFQPAAEFVFFVSFVLVKAVVVFSRLLELFLFCAFKLKVIIGIVPAVVVITAAEVIKEHTPPHWFIIHSIPYYSPDVTPYILIVALILFIIYNKGNC